jgi:hypothetical protein
MRWTNDLREVCAVTASVEQIRSILVSPPYRATNLTAIHTTTFMDVNSGGSRPRKPGKGLPHVR